MTQDEIDANADTDPVNPTWTDEMLDRAVLKRSLRLAVEQSESLDLGGQN